jgi:hypothetical protein
MSFNHEAVAALPVATAADKALIRALCTRRFAYSLAAAESAANFVAVDPDTGVIPLNLIQNNILFQYDSTDTTTIADGVTCLVSNDGKRYKSATVTPPYSVLTRATTAQPVSPAVGDTYLIPTAATGAAWAGKDGTIGIFTASGWVFAVSPIGRFLYVKDETAFYHRNAAGNWTAGVGSIALGAGSVSLPNVLGATASYVVKVENQTTNTPPVSPVTPTAYIIGPSPTGSWSGNAGRLAICLVAGAFTIITPVNGDQVYDKAQNNAFTFNGTTWLPATGALLKHDFVEDKTGAGISTSGSTFYVYSNTTAPTTSNFTSKDATSTITWTAKKVGAKLRFTYSFLYGSSSSNISFGILQDSISAAVNWAFVSTDCGDTRHFVQLIFLAPDVLSHTYNPALFIGSGSAGAAVSHRFFQVEEFA